MRPFDADAIEYHMMAKEDWLGNTIEDSKMVWKADIDSMPTVDAVPQWIPCSERLPNHDEYIKNNGLFIVSDGDRSYSEYLDVNKQMFGEHTISGFHGDYAVIAWMPLPIPYERKEE